MYDSGMDEIHPLDKPGVRAQIMAAFCVSPQVISNWKTRGTPVEHCNNIEKITAGKVTRQELRPDDFWEIWPDLDRFRPVEAAKVAINPVAEET